MPGADAPERLRTVFILLRCIGLTGSGVFLRVFACGFRRKPALSVVEGIQVAKRERITKQNRTYANCRYGKVY